MSSVALTAISVTVGLFFVFFGTLKLAPLFSDELYRDMRKIFIVSSRVFPLSSWTGWSPNPHVIRRIYGTLEVVCGMLMAACPGKLKDASNLVLLLLMIFTLYGVWQLDQGLKEASHALVFGLLLTCRLVIRLQVFERDKSLSEEFDRFVEEQRRTAAGNRGKSVHHTCKRNPQEMPKDAEQKPAPAAAREEKLHSSSAGCKKLD